MTKTDSPRPSSSAQNAPSDVPKSVGKGGDSKTKTSSATNSQTQTKPNPSSSQRSTSLPMNKPATVPTVPQYPPNSFPPYSGMMRTAPLSTVLPPSAFAMGHYAPPFPPPGPPYRQPSPFQFPHAYPYLPAGHSPPRHTFPPSRTDVDGKRLLAGIEVPHAYGGLPPKTSAPPQNVVPNHQSSKERSTPETNEAKKKVNDSEPQPSGQKPKSRQHALPVIAIDGLQPMKGTMDLKLMQSGEKRKQDGTAGSATQKKPASSAGPTMPMGKMRTADKSVHTGVRKASLVPTEQNRKMRTAAKSVLLGSVIPANYTRPRGPSKAANQDTARATTAPAPAAPVQSVCLETSRPIIKGTKCSDFSKEELASMPVAMAYRLNDASSEKRALKAQKKRNKPAPKPAPKRAPAKRASPKPFKKPASAKKKKEVNESELTDPDEPIEGGWPAGWKRRGVVRKSGTLRGKMDKYWYSPKTRKQCRSLPEVKRFLKLISEYNGDEDAAWDALKGRR